MSLLALDGIAVARGGRLLLHEVNVAFEAGTLTAVLGANGAGKSSLLAVACGVLAPAAGRVTLDGADLATLDARARARAIALVDPAEPVLAAVTVEEAVAGARFPHHRWWEWTATAADASAIDAALGATRLGSLRNRELGSLSAGERQRVWIAIAHAQAARAVLLDEPTSHLDLRYALETLDLLRRLAASGAAVVAVLHALEEAAQFADRVVVLGAGGVLADGPPRSALTATVLERAFGVRIDVGERDGAPTFRRIGPA